MSEQENPPLVVQRNLHLILSQVINRVHQQVTEYLENLRSYYHEFLTLKTTHPDANPLADDGNKTPISDEAFHTADVEYRKLEKNLNKIAKHIDNKFQYAADAGQDVILQYQKLVNIIHDIDNLRALPETVERNVKLSKKFKKYQKAVDKYNRFSIEFNGYVSEFQAVYDNLHTGHIMITSNDNRTYSVSQENLDNWFKRHTEKNEISKLKDQIKQRIAANRPPPEPLLDTTSLKLTPISIMTMPDTKMET